MLDALGRLRSDHKHFRLYILYIPTSTHSALVTIATTIYISEPSTRGNSFSTPSQITPSDSLIGHYMHFKLECVSIHCKTTCFSSLFHFALFSPIQSQGKIFRARYSGEVRPCSEATTTLHCLQLNLHDAALSALDVAQSGLAES